MGAYSLHLGRVAETLGSLERKGPTAGFIIMGKVLENCPENARRKNK